MTITPGSGGRGQILKRWIFGGSETPGRSLLVSTCKILCCSVVTTHVLESNGGSLILCLDSFTIQTNHTTSSIGKSRAILTPVSSFRVHSRSTKPSKLNPFYLTSTMSLASTYAYTGPASTATGLTCPNTAPSVPGTRGFSHLGSAIGQASEEERTTLPPVLTIRSEFVPCEHPSCHSVEEAHPPQGVQGDGSGRGAIAAAVNALKILACPACVARIVVEGGLQSVECGLCSLLGSEHQPSTSQAPARPGIRQTALGLGHCAVCAAYSATFSHESIVSCTACVASIHAAGLRWEVEERARDWCP
jgi:hypothetical protein